MVKTLKITGNLSKFGSQKQGLKIAIVIKKKYIDEVYKAFKDKDLSITMAERP